MKTSVLSLLWILGVFLLTSCQQQPVQLESGLLLPKDKVWAHAVNDTVTAQTKEKYFGGMELDVIYSAYQHELFVGHNEQDTAKGLTLERWFASLDHPENMCFWLDMKNLTSITADEISELVANILETYHVKDRTFIENYDSWALLRVKSHQLHTSLWVDSFSWISVDTTTWVEKIERQIQTAHPDALSCEYKMFGALTEHFSDQNLFLWHTPAPCTKENVALTRTFSDHPSVKVVLVDYDKPVPMSRLRRWFYSMTIS